MLESSFILARRLSILLAVATTVSFSSFLPTATGSAVTVPTNSLSSQQKYAATRATATATTTATSTTSTSPRGGFTEDSHMPSLFSETPAEADFDKYAACLAATEGLRRIRQTELQQAAALLSEEERAAAIHQVNAKYAASSGRVLRSMGMPVDKFNALGRTIATDPELRKKVKEQAYLYRMAATVEMEKVDLVEEPESKELLEVVPKDKIRLFSESLSEIEELRSKQIQRLTKALKVEKFPDNVNISDPGLLPFLNPKVRAVVEAFPLQAEAIVKKHGLEADEFNRMLEETKRNPLFRWKIQKLVKLADSSSSSSSPDVVVSA